MPSPEKIDTHHKALTLNLDPAPLVLSLKSAPDKKSRAGSL
jgi:hypothetical protein